MLKATTNSGECRYQKGGPHKHNRRITNKKFKPNNLAPINLEAKVCTIMESHNDETKLSGNVTLWSLYHIYGMETKYLKKIPLPQPQCLLGDKAVVFRRLALSDLETSTWLT